MVIVIKENLCLNRHFIAIDGCNTEIFQNKLFL